jgi:hypothetical protein
MSRRCGICHQPGHNRVTCPQRDGATANVSRSDTSDGGPVAVKSRVIPFAAPVAAAEKHVRSSKRYLCIGDDVRAVRAVYNSFFDVQFETIPSEALVVARSHKWEAVFIATTEVLDKTIHASLFVALANVPFLAITSRFDPSVWDVYRRRGVLAYFDAAEVERDAIDLPNYLDRAINLKETGDRYGRAPTRSRGVGALIDPEDRP